MADGRTFSGSSHRATGLAGHEGLVLALWVRVRFTGTDAVVACGDFVVSASKPRTVGLLLGGGRTSRGTYGASIIPTTALPVVHGGGQPT